MQVQNSSATLALLSTHQTQANRPNVDNDEKTDSKTSAAVTTGSASSASNAATGTTGSRLSAETTAELIKNTQQSSEDEPILNLPVATRHHLDDIANNQGYAAEQASQVGKYPIAIVMSGGIPTNNSSPVETAAFLRKSTMVTAANETAFAPRKALYESKKAEGMPPAQIFAELLAFNATQTEYNALADKMQGKPDGYTTNVIKAEHAYLQQAIAQANSSKATG